MVVLYLCHLSRIFYNKFVMGGTCSNSGKVIKNRESGYSGKEQQYEDRENDRNYQNISDSRTATNSSSSRKGSFSEAVLKNMNCAQENKVEKNGRQVTMKQLAKHNSESSAWTSYKGVVYDVTKYLKIHPGGMKKLLRGCGKECDLLIEIYHRNVKVDELLKKDVVGYLIKEEQDEKGKENQKA